MSKMADDNVHDYVLERVARGLGEPVERPSEIGPPPTEEGDGDLQDRDMLFDERLGRLEGVVEGLKRGSEMSDPTREEIQAQIAASEARGETKLARLEGKLDLVLQAVQEARSESRDNRRAIIANGWVIFGALIVVTGVLVTVAPVVFDLGFKWRETITKEVQDRIPQSPTPRPQK
jgi:hypothetical protein